MSFHPFETTAVHIVYVGLGFFIVLFGMFSLFIKEKLYLGEAPIAAVFGIIIGPAALGLFNPSHWANNHTEAPGGHITDEITLEVMRVTIALSVFAVGVELPKKYLLRHWRSIALLLGPVMVWGWLITASFMYALVPGLDFLNCLVVASCVTPTDPILAQAVVGGPWAEKHVPAHLRHMLMCESGCNDGAAFPFLYLALFLTTNRDNHGKAIAEWFYDAWAYQIIFGTILGALIGWAARKLMRFSERHRLVDRESFVAQYVSLAIASMGVNVLLGSDDLLAAFACGTAFAWDGWFTRQTEDSNFSSIVDLLFNVATFIYIGALMPFRDWAGGTSLEPNTLSIWRLFVLAICVLLTKRLPIVLILWRWIPDIKTFREAVFAGHFGPIGVGAIFIATLARTLLPEEVPSPPETTNDILALTVQPVIFFFVLCSIVIHGLTIPFFAFSKRATTITRTWSRNPSFMAGDDEPNWMTRFRKTKTGESLTGEESNMTEIQRVLNAQLGKIGRGAIGGDVEKELRREDTTPDGEQASSTAREGDDSDHSRVGGLYNIRTERDMKGADDEYEEEHGLEKEDPMGEWGGDDTIEMKRYRQKLQQRKEAEYADVRRKQQDTDSRRKQSSDERQRDSKESDLSIAGVPKDNDDDDDDGDDERAPMDRDLNQGRIDSSEEDEACRQDKEGQIQWGNGGREERKNEREHEALLKSREEEKHFPRSRTWVEGHKLVIEHQTSKSCDPEVVVIPLMDDEMETIARAKDPAHAWSKAHAEKIQFHLGLDDVHTWHEGNAANHLVHHRIPHLYNEYLSRRGRRRHSISDSKEERERRSQVLYESMNWAANHRDDSNERPAAAAAAASSLQSSENMHRPTKKKKKITRPESPEEAPVSGWLAASGAPRRIKQSNRHASPSADSASPNRKSFRNEINPRKQFVSRPSASDVRRMTLTKKVCCGELSLAKGGLHTTHDDETDVEVVDPPHSIFRSSTSSSNSMPRTNSAGGLGAAATPSIDSSKRSIRSSQSSLAFLQVPRSATIESSRSDREPDRRRAMQNKSSSVQWLDINDSTHDHLSTPQSITRPNSPSREKGVDPARIGGGITPRSASPNRLNDRLRIKREESLEAGAQDSQASGFKRKGRIASLLSHIAAPSSSSSSSSTRGESFPVSAFRSLRSATHNDDEDDDDTSSAPRSSSLFLPGVTEGGILTPPSRLNYNNNSNDTTQDSTSNPTPGPGVTFNL